MAQMQMVPDAEQYFENVKHIQLAQLNRLRQETKLLDMDIIVSGVAIALSMPLLDKGGAQRSRASPRVVHEVPSA